MIVLLLTTRDEPDVLRRNVEHHLGWGVDHVAVCDNESGEETRAVLSSFGSAVSTERFADFADRQAVRMRLLDRLRERHRVEWAGVSDTDEFLWHPGAAGLGELLSATPADVVAVTFHQKLFLPTEVDAAEGPVDQRQLHRAGSYDSPLFRSYREGKTVYRGAWLREITSEHRCHEVPHPWWGPERPVVHHYMIRDEDQFVMKVRRLTAWRRRRGLASRLWYHRLRAAIGLPVPPHVAGFKEEWWAAWRDGGEEGLRRYYRERFRVQARDLGDRLAAGDLVRDAEFAAWRASRSSTSGGASGPPTR